MSSKEIGGFFELEINDFNSMYHDKAIAVNSGRNALEYILKANKYSKIYLPYFTCEAVLEPISKLNIPYEFYNIDEKFYPKFDFSVVKKDEGFIYTNYFGLCDIQVEKLVSKFDNLVIDNSQAYFFKKPIRTPSFYSPRKFFGVSDGGFLYNHIELDVNLESDSSLKRVAHLIGRVEQKAEKLYDYYLKSEAELQGELIKKMSKLTQKILCSVDYNMVKNKRRQNYEILHKEFCLINKLTLPDVKGEVPLCYPLLLNNGTRIKQLLIQEKIYIPTYWPNVLEWTTPEKFEFKLTKNLVCLPIDQRYGENEMKRIIKLVKSFL